MSDVIHSAPRDGEGEFDAASSVQRLGRQAEMAFRADAHAPGLSREFVRDMLAVWHAEDLDTAAELVTTELVSNAVRHAMSDARVVLTWTPPMLRIEVLDTDHAVPVVVDQPGEHGGFGMHLIAELAHSFGVEQHPDGKVVWCQLTRNTTRSR